eukprot:TRINITY_DN3970_c0_g2_i3.p1 TRINITY_DN3970_c0_g2~~TRINITY_DN3970_c0_g2_i3.p1  ORF type:complete len:373 (+),score=103.86 TRINITY_DN3970_c0_g2_i3:26-1144(+)
MKLLKRFIDKDGHGHVVLRAEETEDLWHAYHIIAIGDTVTASSIRKIQKESATGSIDTDRVKVSVSITVAKVDFDPASETMRLSGPVAVENKFIKMGAFHTLDVELNKNFTVEKAEWDPIALDRIATACEPAHHADAAAIVMSEGLAHLCLLTQGMTIVKSKIETAIPRKRKSAISGHEKALHRFFDAVMQAILRHVDFTVVKVLAIASPGFTKDQFLAYLTAEALRQDIRPIIENKGKFILAHSSSGHKHALQEVLRDPTVAAKLEDTQAAGEVRALGEFYQMLKVEPDRAFYGFNHVKLAQERQAVQTLLLTDELFRAADIARRKQYLELVQAVKDGGGEVRLFSSMHPSGEQLQKARIRRILSNVEGRA